MTIDTFPGGAIVPATQEADALRSGTLDYAYSAGGYNKHLNPAFPLYDQMAGGLSTTQLYYWLQIFGDQLAAPEYLKYDIVYLCSQLGPPEDFAYTKGIELKTVDDVKKLKMRTAGVGGEIMAKLGASVVTLPGGELYESMQRGVINAFEYSGAASFWDMKFQEVTSNVYLSYSRAPSDSNNMLVSKKAWTALPDDLKSIVMWIQRGAQQITWERSIHRNGEAVEKMKAYGLKVEKLPKVIEDAVLTTAKKYFDDEAAKYGADSLYAKVVKSMREYKALAEAAGVY
jgi:TRAP-type mannitol/chloroaromatic compound transport system substrate-binding protein